MFGNRALVSKAVENGWYISMNAICLRSKTYSKVVRDTPLDRLMLETDAPWLHPSFDKDKRCEPVHVRAVAERVAEIKKIDVEEVINTTTKNSIEFYDLKLQV
jgi:TatD DNase family protein